MGPSPLQNLSPIFIPMHQHSSSKMEVQLQSSTIIAQGDPHATPTEIPLTIFDRFASYIHIAVLFAFAPPSPSNPSIISGLLNILPLFPRLNARIGRTADGRLPCLLLGGPGSGILLVEATVASKLSDHLPLEPSPDFELLHPPWEGVDRVFQVQLNRFQCGGIVIATTTNHRVADGQAMSTFFVAWGKAVRGIAIDPLPVHDLSWLTPRCPPRTEFDHWGHEFIGKDLSLRLIEVEPELITNILLHYSPDFITKLKTSISEKRTTFEILLGHLWRKITIVRELNEDELAMVRLTVNGRQRLRPPVAKEFFGNVVLNAYPKAKVGELIDGGLAGAARIIHEAVAVIGEDYFRSFIDFGAIHEEEELMPVYDVDGNVVSPDLEVDSWLGIGFQEVDFGGGGALCGFLPTWVPVDGLVIMLPSLSPDGGIDIVVDLLEQNAMKLKEISHSLD